MNMLLNVAGLMSPNIRGFLGIWNEISRFKPGDISDDMFMDVIARQGIDEAKHRIYFEVFRSIRSILTANNIDEWADAMNEETIFKIAAFVSGAINSILVDSREAGSLDGSVPNSDSHYFNLEDQYKDFH